MENKGYKVYDKVSECIADALFNEVIVNEESVLDYDRITLLFVNKHQTPVVLRIEETLEIEFND